MSLRQQRPCWVCSHASGRRSWAAYDRQAARERPACVEGIFAGAGFGGAMGGLAGAVRPADDDPQSDQLVAKGADPGPTDGRSRRLTKAKGRGSVPRSCVSTGKGWRQKVAGSLCGPFPRRAHGQNPRTRRCAGAADPNEAHGRSGGRHRKRSDRPPRPGHDAACRQGVANSLRRAVTKRWVRANIPPRLNRKDPIRFSPCPLPGLQSRRALLQQVQELPTDRHPVRQACRNLPRHP